MKTIRGTQEVISELAVSYAERNDFRAISSMLSGGQISMNTLISVVYEKLGVGKLSAVAATFYKDMTDEEKKRVSDILSRANAMDTFRSQVKEAADLEGLLSEFKENIIADLGQDYNANYNNSAQVLKEAILKMDIKNDQLRAFEGRLLHFLDRHVIIPIKRLLQGKQFDEIALETMLAKIASFVVSGVIADLKAKAPEKKETHEFKDPKDIINELIESYINENKFSDVSKMVSIKQTTVDNIVSVTTDMDTKHLINFGAAFYSSLTKDQRGTINEKLAGDLKAIKEFKKAARTSGELEAVLTSFKDGIVRDLGNDYDSDLESTAALLKNSIAQMKLDNQNIEFLKGEFLYSFETCVTIPLKAWLQGREFDEIAAETIAARVAEKVVPGIIEAIEQNLAAKAKAAEEAAERLAKEHQLAAAKSNVERLEKELAADGQSTTQGLS